jgi:hypothetical protein
MISDPDIWGAAQLVVKRHDADAPIVAAQRADELFEEGDLDGCCSVEMHPVRGRGVAADDTKGGAGEDVS